MATPRECEIGANSPLGSPILVCTGADAVRLVYERTVPERRQDLVFLQNGIVRTMLPPCAPTATCAVLYFSVLERGGPAKGGGCSFVHGRFAPFLARLLRAGGLECKEVKRLHTIEALAAEKLLWASCMWMVCHAHGGMSVGQVHDTPACQQTLRELVAELLPVAARTLSPAHGDGELLTVGAGDEIAALDNLDSVCARMEAYSRRIHLAVPSKKMALEELAHRCLCVCVCVCVRVCVCARDNARAQARHSKFTCPYAPAPSCPRTHACMCSCMNACTHLCTSVNVCMHVHACACMFMCPCVYMHA